MKRILYAVVIASVFASCSSEPHYMVKGTVEGSDSVKFYLQKRENGKMVKIDSAISQKGTFTMKAGKVDYPVMVQLIGMKANKRAAVAFYLENSEINISGTLDSLFKASVTGSKTNDENKAFSETTKPLSTLYGSLYGQYQAANQNGDAARVSALEKSIDSVEKEITKLEKLFVKNNPSSYVTPNILQSISYDMTSAEIESSISALDTAISNLPQMKSLKERAELMKTVEVGKKAPDFTMNDPDGNPVTLSSKFGSKLLLVDFWAAWCGPCRGENPNVVKVYNEFNKKGFDVFGVSLDREKADWVKAIADDKLTWTHVSDLAYWSNAAAKLYAVNAIPANFLLDETGTIIGKNLRGDDLYNKVKEVLGGK